MKTSENRKFEEEWKDAIEGAEIAPSDRLWNSIDLKLSHAERGEMKKRVLFYQRLAAASVLFALCLGAAGWFWNYDGAGVKSLASQQPVGENQSEAASATPTQSSSAANTGSTLASVSESPSTIRENSAKANVGSGSKSLVEKGEKANSSRQEASVGDKIAVVTAPSDKNDLQFGNSGMTESKSGLFNAQSEEGDLYKSIAVSGIALSEIHLSGKPVEQIESARTFKVAKKEEKRSDVADGNWWASLNGSGGAYNQSSSSNLLANSLIQQGPTTSLNGAPSSREVGVGTSFTYGMSVGKKIANRWVVMGGVNYLNQSIDYNSNIVLQDASQSKVFVADLASPSSSLASTAPYLLRNTNEFISIPVQAGYLLVNRKAGVQLNAGVAADIFYRNTMTDLSGKFGSFSQDAGENSTYRSLNWTGLLGTELSYRMNKHYHVSLIPGFRYSFNSVLKSSTGSTINPLVWDVGFRLKYVF